MKCKKCGKEFKFPAYVKRAEFYDPVCPHCDKKLYRS
ncbi:MAG: zinc ribbon-containing protein [Candidatus Bathyarchaeota archaeon]|nr:zinc ribbon-containing protein [Candidatus Bathyarchaeota archaeon]